MTQNEFDIIIERGRTEMNYWRDVWRYRELFYILSWRDIKVRYKQTFIGAAWSIIRPLLTMITFTIVFSRIAKLQAPGDVPYPLLVLAGLLPWQFFSSSLSEASGSLVGNTNLITKVYFPRLIIPASAIITGLIDFGFSLIMLLFLMSYYHFVPTWQMILLPFMLLLTFIFSFGISLIITALNVKYRDFKHVVPFIIQFGLYISPVGFSSLVIPEKWQLWYNCNPMVGIIECFRWCILGGNEFPYMPFLFSSLASCGLFIAGVTYFRSTEKSFADSI